MPADHRDEGSSPRDHGEEIAELRRRVAAQEQALAELRREVATLRSEPMETIRNVPDEVRDELAARARMSGRSLQE